jgi:hypothetical protein
MKILVLVAAVCILVGQHVSGWNRLCFYDCLSGTVVIAVGALEFCPLSIEEN